MTPSCFVHATVVVAGEVGVLIEGPPGSGKSSLALALMARAPRLVRLVGDDRVVLAVAGGRLLARPHPRIAGLIECRGQGLLRVEHEPACVIGLVVRREDHPERLPEARPETEHLGVRHPLLRVSPAASATDAAARTLEAIWPHAGSACFERVQSACQRARDPEH